MIKIENLSVSYHDQTVLDLDGMLEIEKGGTRGNHWKQRSRKNNNDQSFAWFSGL